MRRRTFLAGAAAAAVGTTGLTACQGNGAVSSSNPKALNVYANGDTNVQDLWSKTLIPGFQSANSGVSINLQFDLHGDNSSQVLAKISAATQQQKDPGIDLVEALANDAGQAGLLVDPKGKVANVAAIDTSVMSSASPGAIPYRASSVLLAYTPQVTDPPKTLDELLAWIKAHPGKFAYNSPKSGGSGNAFVTTVLDKYVPSAARDQMTSGYHKDLESHWAKGWQTLAGLNPYVYQKGVYPNGNNGTLELMQSGQIWMAPVWSDQFLSGRQSGLVPKNAEATQISNPSFTGGVTTIGVLKASAKQDLAFSLANWILEPAQQSAIAEKIQGYPVISLSKLPAAVQTEFKAAKPGELRPTYNSDMNNDLQNLWDQKVPGQS